MSDVGVTAWDTVILLLSVRSRPIDRSKRHEQTRPREHAMIDGIALSGPGVASTSTPNSRCHAPHDICLAIDRGIIAFRVDQARQDVLSICGDKLSTGRALNLSLQTNLRDAIALDDNRGVLSGGAAIAVDQRAALDDDRPLLLANSNRHDCAGSH